MVIDLLIEILVRRWKIVKLHEFKQRLKLAIKIIFGYDIIVYEENTKIVNLVINNCLDIADTKHDYVLDKGHVFKDNNGEIRYFGGKEWK